MAFFKYFPSLSATTLCLLPLLFFFACQPSENQPQEQVQHYGTGEVSRRFSTVAGKKEGKMTDYFPDGKVKGERLFENDVQVGRSVFYYPSGKIKESQYFQNGLKHGGDTTWYEDGRLQFVMEFSEGKQHGYVRKWAPDGSLTFEAKYEMDTLVEVKGETLKRRR